MSQNEASRPACQRVTAQAIYSNSSFSVYRRTDPIAPPRRPSRDARRRALVEAMNPGRTQVERIKQAVAVLGELATPAVAASWTLEEAARAYRLVDKALLLALGIRRRAAMGRELLGGAR